MREDQISRKLNEEAASSRWAAKEGRVLSRQKWTEKVGSREDRQWENMFRSATVGSQDPDVTGERRKEGIPLEREPAWSPAPGTHLEGRQVRKTRAHTAGAHIRHGTKARL